MDALMMHGKRFLLIFILALLFVQCGKGDQPPSPPQILGNLDLTTLPSALRISPVTSAQQDQTKILVVALGPDDEWIEAKVAPDGSFVIPCKTGHNYTLSFVAEDSQGQRTLIAVVAYVDGDSWLRLIKVSNGDVDLGLVRLEQGEDGNWIGVPQHALLVAEKGHGDKEPPAVVEANRIILPKPGNLTFYLVQAHAALMSELYLTVPFERLLIADRNPEPVGISDLFEAGTEIRLAIEVDGGPLGLGTYRHSSLSGYAKVKQLSDLRWQVSFEDLPWYLADWDFNDLEILMTLRPVCDDDQDGHKAKACGGDDYCDHDPNNWTEAGCANCMDEDGDFWFSGCDAYSTIKGPDCDDGNDSVYPGAPERCDGIDNQCPGDAGYGLLDEGVCWQKLGADLRVTNDAGTSEYTSLSWTGSEFGVSWQDRRDGNYEIYFARISSSGAKLGSDLRVTNDTSNSVIPSLSWTGSEFGVSWQDYRDGNYEIYFARISSSGAKLGSDLRVTNDARYSCYPSLSWTGSEFGVSWEDDRDLNWEIYFARISSSGAKLGSDLRVTNDASSSMHPSLSWTGSEFGMSWEDIRDRNYEIYFARVSSAGAKLGSDLRATNAAGASLYPSLSWTGSEFGVSWMDYGDGNWNWEIYFARVSSSGAKLGSDLRVTNAASDSGYPSLSWTGSEFGVSWEDFRDGNAEIYFALVSSADAKLGEDLRVTNDASSSELPSLSWTGSEFGVSWQDNRDGNVEIYFARIGYIP